MPLWEVQRRPGKVYSEPQLVRRIGRGKLAPDDAVRPLGEVAWRAVSEVVSPSGSLARAHRVHRWRQVQGLVWHVGVFVGVAAFTPIPRVAVFWWGLALAVHAFKTLSRLLYTGAQRLPTGTSSGASTAARSGARAPEGSPARAAPAPAPGDPFLAELSAVLDDLDRIAREREVPGTVDLAALRTAAQELRRRHLEMARLGDPTTLERLTRERDQALSRAGAASDPRTEEVLRDQARSVSERLDSIREAAEAAGRLEARERTLLHQLESLRLGMLRSGADEARAPELAGEARRLQAALRAEAEIDNTLAEARMRATRLPEGGG